VIEVASKEQGMVSGERQDGEVSTVRVRPAASDDGQAVRELLAEVATFHIVSRPHLIRITEEALKHDTTLFAGRSFAQVLEDPEALLLVAEADGAIIGVLLAMLERSPAPPPLEPRRYLHVHSLAVRAEWRRVGAGRVLMGAADAWTRQAGVTDIELHVWEFNPAARAFYEALGYETVERRMWRSIAD
jgi:ribosomal protein S18 acetylase RimI-like enzyme